MLMSTVNYLLLIVCTHVAANYDEQLQDIIPEQQEETYVGLLINK